MFEHYLVAKREIFFNSLVRLYFYKFWTKILKYFIVYSCENIVYVLNTYFKLKFILNIFKSVILLNT